MQKWIPQLALMGLFVLPGVARADRVDGLIASLKTASAEAKLGTLVLLQKSADPRAPKALVAVLADEAEAPRVRAQAAASLQLLGAEEAVPALRKAARARDAYLKARAKLALESFCPRNLKRKRYYVNLSHARATGPMQAVAQRLAIVKLRELLGVRDDVVLGWPGCRPPSKRQARRKAYRQLKTYFLDAVVTVIAEAERSTVRIQLLLNTWPKQSIKGSAEASSMLPRKLTRRRLGQLVNALLDGMKSDLARLLP